MYFPNLANIPATTAHVILNQRPYAVVMTSSAVSASMRKFLGVQVGESGSVSHHGYSSVCDASSLLLGKVRKAVFMRHKEGNMACLCFRTRGENVIRVGAAPRTTVSSYWSASEHAS